MLNGNISSHKHFTIHICSISINGSGRTFNTSFNISSSINMLYLNPKLYNLTKLNPFVSSSRNQFIAQTTNTNINLCFVNLFIHIYADLSLGFSVFKRLGVNFITSCFGCFQCRNDQCPCRVIFRELFACLIPPKPS